MMGETYYRADIINSIFGDGVLTTEDRPLALTSALLSHIPFADVEPVRHGRWEGYIHSRYCGMDEYGEPVYRDGTVYYCSNPKCRRKTVVKENYCPNCGAKMDLTDTAPEG